MRNVTCSMGVSVDGYIVGPDGDFDWTGPDEELFDFVTNETREVGVYLLGRRLYETMLYWETADQDPSLDDALLEWAAIWKPLPKVVFPQRERRGRLPGGLCGVPAMPPPLDPVAERLGPQARLGDQRVPFLPDLVVRRPLAAP